MKRSKILDSDLGLYRIKSRLGLKDYLNIRVALNRDMQGNDLKKCEGDILQKLFTFFNPSRELPSHCRPLRSVSAPLSSDSSVFTFFTKMPSTVSACSPPLTSTTYRRLSAPLQAIPTELRVAILLSVPVIVRISLSTTCRAL